MLPAKETIGCPFNVLWAIPISLQCQDFNFILQEDFLQVDFDTASNRNLNLNSGDSFFYIRYRSYVCLWLNQACSGKQLGEEAGITLTNRT